MKSKITSWDELAEQASRAREKGLKVVFTNGCFDLLHVGHVRYLAEAKNQGDILVMGLNSDKSVSRIKGPKRPVTPENERAEVLAALECVDFITLFDEPDPLKLIEKVRPDVLVKGADWAEDDIIGAREVKGWGGQAVRVKLAPGASTTGIIERIVKRFNV